MKFSVRNPLNILALVALSIALYIGLVCAFIYNEEATSNYPIVDEITKAGYPVEVHGDIVTEDGYLLDMQRIKHGKNAKYNENAPVVFLMHGLTSSAASFVIIQDGLAYVLADSGYDVWLGNARGTIYSRKHINHSISYADYWDFSWHEIGIYDVKACLKHILKETGKEKITYIGHSQGTSSFFVLASEQPEINKHIHLMIAIAPIVHMDHVTHVFVTTGLKFSNQIQYLLQLMGVHSFALSKQLIPIVSKLVCNSVLLSPICSFSLYTNNYSYESLAQNTDIGATKYLELILQGYSLRQIYHFGQLIQTGKFRKYDYGIKKNLIKYKSAEPPDYDLKKVSAPVVIYFSNVDMYMKRPDITKLCFELPNVVDTHEVSISNFNHLDFAVRHGVVELYKEMLKEIANIT